MPKSKSVDRSPKLPVNAVVGDNGGPGQPEMQSFTSVSDANLVDLFSGDFHYSIPLIDVGGYPVALGYNSGITMDQDASWVGLGWNINPGTITRNMRGLPDDFNGTDSIRKEMNIRENRTVGVTAGFDLETMGVPLSFGASLGVFHNAYRGWGHESALNASINGGAMGAEPLVAGLSITNNSQDGFGIKPSIGFLFNKERMAERGGIGGIMTVGLPYNSRYGLRSLEVNSNLHGEGHQGNKAAARSINSLMSSGISFANQAFTPGISMPYSNHSYTITVKGGAEIFGVHPNLFISGYLTRQFIDKDDRVQTIPAFGYLNFQEAESRPDVLLDFNREKEVDYREKPGMPHIGMPAYTYDVFTITGEGTGGSFRPYRTDIGYVHDNQMKTRDHSGRFSVDLGGGNLFHGGADLNVTRSYAEAGPWTSENPLARTLAFRKPMHNNEAAYFRNPGELTVNTKAFYDAIGGDDLITANLFQPASGSMIMATNSFSRYKNQRHQGNLVLSPGNAIKKTRDKRSQVISYLTAEEAETGALSRFIEVHQMNKFDVNNCDGLSMDVIEGEGDGLLGRYFSGKHWAEEAFHFVKVDTVINFSEPGEFNVGRPPLSLPIGPENFSVRWTGRVKAPFSGTYVFISESDDGSELFINNEQMIDNRGDHVTAAVRRHINLVAGEMYDIRLEYNQGPGFTTMRLKWIPPNQPEQIIPKKYLYSTPRPDKVTINDALVVERRVSGKRKAGHLSEVTVLNGDGKRYVYGLPVYNLKQREATFSVNASRATRAEGMVGYNKGVDDSMENNIDRDRYFSGEEVPAYAHSFLLTGIVSDDYVDIKGDGITDDDAGEAVKFNYTRTASAERPFGWRAPYSDSASYSEGLRTDYRDDRGNYMYGEKELWYLHSIESRNMIATFVLEDRQDMRSINKNGVRTDSKQGKRLREINLYTKSDFRKWNILATPIKTVHFQYGYELCPGVNGPGDETGKLTLQKVWFTYNGNKKGERNPYIFKYNQHNPRYNAQSSDRWGSYKEAMQNPGSVAGNQVTNAEFPYALQDSSKAARNAAAWALDSIVMPSGARMKITYEADDYAFVQHKRAMQMFGVAGFSDEAPAQVSDLKPELYAGLSDCMYVGVHVPKPVSSKKELYHLYLEGVEKTHFRLHVKMPTDKWGSGYENVPTYATLDLNGGYGFINGGNTIWFKVKPVDKDGAPVGKMSPMAKAAVQFLRMNLPSKAFPGSDVGDDLSPVDAMNILFSMADNIHNALHSFDLTSRSRGWAKKVDLTRTFVRLNNPFFKKIGGGHRVKRIVYYDHWNAMTGQKESKYGTEYAYTTNKEVDGKYVTVSSGVAAWEPGIGGEENPWRLPIEYTEQLAPLAPINMGYTEEPLGESFFPGASVGYSKVSVRSIHAKNIRSANGYTETAFYTAFDFPTIAERTNLAEGKKRYRPVLSKFLKINAKHYIGLTQGFKVELNDMHGKLKSTATYAASDSVSPIQYTEYFYRVENQHATHKRLVNNVQTMGAAGVVASDYTIGKDIELMVDMREHRHVTNGNNYSANGDLFMVGIWPFLLPSLINMAQREENKFRSVATTKVISRHGILDSIVAIEKGSKIVTRNLIFDSESGNVVLSNVQNEFNDPVYRFSYPAAWAYDGMSGAYKNIDNRFYVGEIHGGRVEQFFRPAARGLFAPGDEVLVRSLQRTGGTVCNQMFAYFSNWQKVWAVDAGYLDTTATEPDIFFVDRDGKPFSGHGVNMRVIRSGRRNVAASIGEVTSLRNPVRRINGRDTLIFDTDTRVLEASAVEFRDLWKVADRKLLRNITSCVPQTFQSYLESLGECPEIQYSNKQLSKSFKSTVCEVGTKSKDVVYTVWAGVYSSRASQAAADSMAMADINANGQAWANAQAECLFYSGAHTVIATKNDCGLGTGSAVAYSVPSGKYTSAVSQADADALALAEANARAQENANLYGNCGFQNRYVSVNLMRSNCGPGATASGYVYTVPAGKFSSNISQDDADRKADEDIQLNGQRFADSLGLCTYFSVANAQTYTRDNCGDGNDGGEYTYVVPARKYSSTISQADADNYANADQIANGQSLANIYGSCKYYSALAGSDFTRNNCPAGAAGATMRYEVGEGTYTSTISQADANQKAIDDVNANGQAYVNANAACIYSSAAYGKDFQKNNCAAGYTGTIVNYAFGAGAFTSTISQADADQKAVDAVNANGQANANANGTCAAAQVYAKLSVLSPHTTTQTTPIANIRTTTALVAVGFYADAACTVPVTPVVAPLVNIYAVVDRQTITDGMLEIDPPYNTPTQSFQSTGQLFLIYQNAITWEEVAERRWDENNMEIEPSTITSTVHTYKLAPGTGYIIVN